MTEDEAKTKWCPFTRILQTRIGRGSVDLPFGVYTHVMDLESGAAVNRDWGGKPIGNCIGSACMAWDKLEGRESPGDCRLMRR